MDAVLGVAVLWAAFAGTHIGLAATPVRARLVARLGELGFTLAYSLVAALLWLAVVSYYAAHRLDGPPGLDLGRWPVLRWPLMVVTGLGVVLFLAGVVFYPSAPSALFQRRVRPPRGFERIARHPLFAGSALLGLGHMLLAPHLIGAVFMGGFAVLGLLGGWHQDGKLRARHGAAYADFLAATSAVPFVALVTGRQPWRWREIPLPVLVAGVLAALGLRAVHADLFTAGGLWISGTLILGAAWSTFQTWRRARVAGAEAARG